MNIEYHLEKEKTVIKIMKNIYKNNELWKLETDNKKVSVALVLKNIKNIHACHANHFYTTKLWILDLSDKLFICL